MKKPTESMYPLPVFASWESKEFKVELSIDLATAQLELIWPVLYESKTYLGSQLLDDTPVNGRSTVLAYFHTALDANPVFDAVRATVPEATATLGFRHYYDIEKYFSQFNPIETNKLWVGPPWMESKAPKKKARLVIPPQDVFGCRGHPTTQMVLQFLEENPRLKGSSLFDVGTGTGVLAIAAQLLGCSGAEGNDILPEAVESAKRLARANKVKGRFTTADVTTVTKQYDVVVANIPTSVWPILNEPVLKLVKRDLYVSGYPEQRRAEHEAMFAPLEVVGRKQIGLWASTHFRVKPAAAAPATRAARRQKK